jgi:hypothetical protein
MIISVKGGHLSHAHIRELRGTMERETNAELGGIYLLRETDEGDVA